MKLKELLEVWLERYMKHTIKIRTYNRYKGICELHLIKDLGEYELDELKPKADVFYDADESEGEEDE